jgi:hypothetical protein
LPRSPWLKSKLQLLELPKIKNKSYIFDDSHWLQGRYWIGWLLRDNNRQVHRSKKSLSFFLWEEFYSNILVMSSWISKDIVHLIRHLNELWDGYDVFRLCKKLLNHKKGESFKRLSH